MAMRKELLIAAFGLLSALAVAGWIRKPQAGPLTPDQVVHPLEQRNAAAPSASPVARQVVARSEGYAPAPRSYRAARKPRSTAKSVAIVAGSAGAGAAIGGIAGGKKGAGIGAISGGAAGFIYDQLTRNR